jgi:hypothetical protein
MAIDKALVGTIHKLPPTSKTNTTFLPNAQERDGILKDLNMTPTTPTNVVLLSIGNLLT